MSSTEIQSVAVVAVPFPGQSHLNQLLHFSLILSARGLPVHFAAPSSSIRQAKLRLHGWNSTHFINIHFHELPLPPPSRTSSYPSHLAHAVHLFDTPLLIRPAIASLLRSLSHSYRRLVVIHDTFVSVAGHEAASLPNTESYTFQCVSAFQAIFELHDAHPDRRPIQIGEGTLLNSIVTARFDDWVPAPILERVKRLEHDTPVESGIIANSCRALEGEFLDLHAKEHDGKRIFAVSPLHLIGPKAATTPEKRPDCLNWLDDQPAASVVYVSFGSTTTISSAQVEQLALGLWLSGQRFIWVMRKADEGAITSEAQVGVGGLPERFEEETKGLGMVLTGWAPQVDILEHTSIAAFISHCGWNSTMESLSSGVPIITWPMQLDQPRNAMVVTLYLKVGVEMRQWDRRKEVVPAARVEEVVRMMVVGGEGKALRARAANIGEEIRKDVGEGGSSIADLNSFVARISQHG